MADCVVALDCWVLPLNVPKLAESFAKRPARINKSSRTEIAHEAYTINLSSLLGLSGERRAESAGQRGQQEAAAVHAGMVGVSTVEVKHVAVVSTAGDPRPALAVEPDPRPIDAAVQIAAAPVLGEEVLEPGAGVEPATY